MWDYPFVVPPQAVTLPVDRARVLRTVAPRLPELLMILPKEVTMLPWTDGQVLAWVFSDMSADGPAVSRLQKIPMPGLRRTLPFLVLLVVPAPVNRPLEVPVNMVRVRGATTHPLNL